MSENSISKRKTPLINCVKLMRTFEQIQRIVVSGADINIKDDTGKTALHWCYVYSQAGLEETSIQIVKFLIDHGADINSKDQEGQTPLMLFISKDCSNRLISTLLDCGADETCENVYCRTALYYYSEFNDKNLDICRRLMEGFPDVNVKDMDGITPLMCFLIDGNEKSYIELLLNNGSDVTNRCNDGNTVLHYYAKWAYKTEFVYDDLDILQRLFNDGSLLNARNVRDTTPLMDFILYMLPINEVKFLLDKGADINARDLLGNSVLHMVFPRPNEPFYETMEMLLEYGANPNICNRGGESLLQRAIYSNRDDIIKLLYNYGLSHKIGHTFIATYIKNDYTYRTAYEVIFKYMLLESETALDQHLNKKLTHYKKLRLYVDILIKELRKMKQRNIAYELTLFKYLSEPDPRKSSCLLSNCSVNFKVLETEFPQYADVVRSKVKFSNIFNLTLKRAWRMSISTRHESGQEGSEVELNSDCFDHILGFISDKDIKCLILASLSSQ